MLKGVLGGGMLAGQFEQEETGRRGGFAGREQKQQGQQARGAQLRVHDY
jgi:hypothetical protein